MADYIDVVMTVGPHADGEFVELEDDQGRGVGPDAGIEWIRPSTDDPYWRLRIPWDAIATIGEG
jgi:hypothetical protein